MPEQKTTIKGKQKEYQPVTSWYSIYKEWSN
jgi:hypothetical protein